MNTPATAGGLYGFAGSMNGAAPLPGGFGNVAPPKLGAGGGLYTMPDGSKTPYDPGTNYGDSGMSQSAYEKMYGTPQDNSAANANASAAATAAGNHAASNPAVNPTLGAAASGGGGGAPGQPGVLSGPGYGEQWYQLYGNGINQPTNTQKLFDQGPGATNPLYDNAIDMTNRQINAQTAGRGIYDSSAAIGSIGLADASIRGQQVKDYEALGETADAANTGAYSAASGAAHMAQSDTNQRINSIVGGQTQLSTAQANTIDNFYEMAQKGQLTADMASIEAQIQASGVDAATAQALTNDLLQVAGIGAKAAGGK